MKYFVILDKDSNIVICSDGTVRKGDKFIPSCNNQDLNGAILTYNGYSDDGVMVVELTDKNSNKILSTTGIFIKHKKFVGIANNFVCDKMISGELKSGDEIQPELKPDGNPRIIKGIVVVEKHTPVVKSEYQKSHEKILEELSVFTKLYNEFTKQVSPKHWRITGSHSTALNQMKDHIERFTEATEDEKESEWFKQQML